MTGQLLYILFAV